MATELEKIKIQIRLAAFAYKRGVLRKDGAAVRIADLTLDLAIAELAEQQVKAGEDEANGLRIIDEECEAGFNLTLDQASALLDEVRCDESHM